MASRRRDGGGLLAAAGLVVAVLFCLQGVALSQPVMNITKVLEPYPDYSLQNQWFTQTKVDQEVNNRSTITILAAPNAVFQTYLSSVNGYNNPDTVADTLRYQVLLQYFGPTELSQLPANGTQVPTLLQTTGRANGTQGFVTLYKNGTTYYLGHENVDSAGNETIVNNVTQSPYSYIVQEVNKVLAPVSAALTPTPAPAPAPTPTPSKAPTPAPATTPPTTAPAASSPAGTVEAPATFNPPTDASGAFGSSKKRMGTVALLSAVLLSTVIAALS